MRAISAALARRCETAAGGRCRCRCRGAFHGADRCPDPRQLPDTDPHSPRARGRGRGWEQLVLDLGAAS